MFKKVFYLIVSTFMLASCIENDIPYPIVEAQILSIEVEGQCNGPDSQSSEAVINNKERTVTLYVNDKVDLTQLNVQSLQATEKTSFKVEGYPNFPSMSFNTSDVFPDSISTEIDFTNPVPFKLSIYQDYLWEVTVKQLIDRHIDVKGQVGDPVIDLDARKVVIYVDKSQPFDGIQVNALQLGGASGKVSPNPKTVKDFTLPVTFFVQNAWSDEWHEWTVYVYHASESNNSSSSDVFAMVTTAKISGKVDNGMIPVIEYKKKEDTNWSKVEEVQMNGTSFVGMIKGLSPSTEYEYRLILDGGTGQVNTFTTSPVVELENGDFENWHLEKNKVWNPWPANAESFWDTGNDGAAVVGKSNSTPTSDDTFSGTGKAAHLETKDMFGYLAAGNIFTGTYVRTEVPNGVLSFGRKFNTFPSKLKINFKYHSTPITKTREPFDNLKGEADSCHIYIALTNWDGPLEIRTDPKKRQLFNKNAPEVIAFAEYFQGTSDDAWQTRELELKYRRQERPTYMLIVATSSKYGDYFTGGPGSVLLVDNFELLYD